LCLLLADPRSGVNISSFAPATNTSSSIEITVDLLQVAAKDLLLDKDPCDDTAPAELEALLRLGDGGEWARVYAELSTQADDAVKARQRSVEVPAAVLELAAQTTCNDELRVTIEDPAASSAPRTGEPATVTLVTDNTHANSVN